MAGRLVGEVLAMAPALKASGLPERAFHALVAVAEKCHTDSRRGSVRWDHIRAGLYGASKRTAERAVEDLKKAGLLQVVKPGFNNNHGRVCAPVYEIAPLSDPATQLSESAGTDDAIQVAGSLPTDTAKTGTDTAKSDDRYRQNGDRSRHLGGVLDGSIDGVIDGSIDGGESAGEIVTTAATLEDEPPPLFCHRHPTGTEGPCGGCADARRRRQEWERLHPEFAYHAALNDNLAKMAAKVDTRGEYMARRFGTDRDPTHLFDVETDTTYIGSERVDTDEQVVEETQDHDEPRCDVCDRRLDTDGTCPRCVLVSGGWKRPRREGGVA
jgi:hypothetical protein